VSVRHNVHRFRQDFILEFYIKYLCGKCNSGPCFSVTHPAYNLFHSNWVLHGSEDSSRCLLGCEDGGKKVLRKGGILPQRYTASQPEDGGSEVLRNVGTSPHHYKVSRPKEGGSEVLRNIGILPQHYTVSQPGRP